MSAIAAFALAAEVRGGEPKQRAKNVELLVRLDQDKPVWQVGEELTVCASLRCVAEHQVKIVDWDKAKLFRALFMFPLIVREIPGQNPRPYVAGPIGDFEVGPRPAQADFRSLEPGKDTSEVKKTFCLMVPGRAEFLVMCSLRDDPIDAVDDSQAARIPGAATGYRSVWVKTSVNAEMPKEMAQRYARAELVLTGSGGDSGPRLKLLKQIAEEKHLFAARLIHKTWKEAKDPTVRSAALQHLISLLEFGTAYESFDDLLEVLADEGEATENRQRLLAFLGGIRIFTDHVAINVAQQAFFYPSSDWQKKAQDLLRKLAKDPDPFLAAAARRILEQDKPATSKESPGKEKVKTSGVGGK